MFLARSACLPLSPHSDDPPPHCCTAQGLLERPKPRASLGESKDILPAVTGGRAPVPGPCVPRSRRRAPTGGWKNSGLAAPRSPRAPWEPKAVGTGRVPEPRRGLALAQEGPEPKVSSQWGVQLAPSSPETWEAFVKAGAASRLLGARASEPARPDRQLAFDSAPGFSRGAFPPRLRTTHRLAPCE